MKRHFRLLVPALLLALLMPMVLSQAAFAAPPETTDAFVCPVLGGHAGEHGNSDAQPFITIAGGSTSLLATDPADPISVPITATNDDGAGSPGGDHASPGDDGYTAIWALP